MDVETLPRVRWPVAAIPGQSLPGLIVATAEFNGHINMRSIMDFARLRATKGLGVSMREPSSREALAHVLGQPQSVVDERALMLTEPIGEMDAIDFFGARIPANDVLYNRRRVGETTNPTFHHKAVWQLITMPIDPDDGSVLVDHCASCGAHLGWRTTDNARRCDAIFANPESVANEKSGTGSYSCNQIGAGANDIPRKVSDEALKGVSLLCNIIDPRPEQHLAVQATLHPTLRDIDRGAIFYLGLKLGRAIGLHGGGKRLLRGTAAPFEEAMIALETGSSVIAGWPGSIMKLMAENAAQDSEAAMAIIKAVRQVYAGAGAWPEHKTLIAEAMPDIVEMRDQHVMRLIMPGMLDGLASAKTMKVNSKQMAALVNAKVVVPVIKRGKARTHGSFRISDVEHIGTILSESVAASVIVEETGIPLYGVEQMMCEKILTHADHAAVSIVFPHLRSTRSSYAALTSKLLDPENHAEITDGSRLRKALLGVGGGEKPWAAVVGAMIDGRLPFTVVPTRQRLIDRILVEQGIVLNSVLAQTFDRRLHRAFPFARHMRQRDALELLNLDYQRYTEISKHLPQEARGPGTTFVTRAILDIAGLVIDRREAWRRYGVKLDSSAMTRSGLGWSRAEIESRSGTTAHSS